MKEKSKAKKVIYTILFVLYWIYIAAAFWFFFMENFIFDTWGSLLADEILFTINSSVKGSGIEPILSALPAYLVAFGLMIGLFVVFHIFIMRWKTAFKRFIIFMLVWATALVGLSFADADSHSGLVRYSLSGMFEGKRTDFVSVNYTDPSQVDIAFPEKKRNLIFIYLESMETTFSDKESGGGFKENTIKELTDIALTNESFKGDEERLNGTYIFPGTNWTSGAMFAQSSGLPLKLVMNSNLKSQSQSFFPELTFLGDVLSLNGYSNTLLLGSKAAFGNRDVLYTEHGAHDIHDYDYLAATERIPKDYFTFWGIEDEKLFENAKTDLTELSKKEEPFSYTMLTVDTHFEDGYTCRLCGNEFGDNKYANVMACSSRQVRDFLDWIRNQDFYENTTVVLSGDHITMDNDFCSEVDTSYDRRALFTIINGDSPLETTGEYRLFSSFDIFPTVLSAMGAEIPGNKLGMGVNLYSPERTLVEKLGPDAVYSELSKPTSFFDDFGAPLITEDMLKEISENITFNWGTDEEGLVYIQLTDFSSSIYKEAVENGYVNIWLTKDNIKTVPFKVFIPNENDTNAYYYRAYTGMGRVALEGCKAECYITVKDFSDYMIKKGKITEASKL